jgi:hypothetical protein
MQTDIHFWSYLAQFFLVWEMFQTEGVETIKRNGACCTWLTPTPWVRLVWYKTEDRELGASQLPWLVFLSIKLPDIPQLLAVSTLPWSLKANSHIPCRSPAMPSKSLDLSFPFDLHGAAVFDSHVPCRARAMPRPRRSERDFSRPRHSAAWAWHVWISIVRPETACGRPARVRLLPATTRSSTNDVKL